jgi:hypothetical protein
LAFDIFEQQTAERERSDGNDARIDYKRIEQRRTCDRDHRPNEPAFHPSASPRIVSVTLEGLVFLPYLRGAFLLERRAIVVGHGSIPTVIRKYWLDAHTPKHFFPITLPADVPLSGCETTAAPAMPYY